MQTLKKWLLFIGLSFIAWSPSVFAFDVISGGGEALLSQTNIDNASKVLLSDLFLTINTAVTNETIIITLPAGTGSLEFSTDPVAITSPNGNFTITNLTQTTGQINFDVTGSGTLQVQNIGVYGTNFGSPFVEDRILNVNFQAADFDGDLFHVDTRDFALWFGGGVLLNASHSSSGAAKRVEDLVIVASSPLAGEVVTVTPDPGLSFATTAVASSALDLVVESTTLLVDLDSYADTDVVNITDGGLIDDDFTVNGTHTVADFVTFLDSITAQDAGFTGSFNNALDVFDVASSATDFTISSSGAMPTLLLGPSNSTTGTLSADNTSIAASTRLVNLEQFADGDIVTATNSAGINATFTVDPTSNIQNLTSFLSSLANLNVTLDSGNVALDFTADEDYTITSDGAWPGVTLDYGEPANLQFVPTLPNFVTTAGSLAVTNASITNNQLVFTLNGVGRLEIQNVSLFADNFDDKGTFFETRFLNVNALATDFAADLMVIDTNPYGTQVTTTGATGGPSSNVFRIGDTMKFTFAPLDYSSRFSEISLDLSGFAGDPIADFDASFTVISDNDDGAFSVPLTVAYSGTNVSQTYNDLTLTIDNQLPSYDLSGHNWIVLPEGKTVGGINDIITLAMPPESSGDTITFSADFSDVAGTIANFVDIAAVDTQIALQEVDVDDAAYTVDITFQDDAGNTIGPITTDPVGIDLIRPILSTANILSIQGGGSPGIIGDIIDVDLPVDTVGSVGDTITFDLDLAAIGGNDANFIGISSAQSFPITAGSLNDVSFNQVLTVYDKALNPVSATTNSIQIDNAVPTFNSSCGATFQVVDVEDTDIFFVADVTNGGTDQIFFLFPDKTQPGCDVERFSVDLSAISATPAAGYMMDFDANGTGRFFTVPYGNFDNTQQQFPITIYDINGNAKEFLTGKLNIDNDLAQAHQLNDRSFETSETTPNGAILANGSISVNLTTTETDIIAVSARIPGAAKEVELQRTSTGGWFGALNILPGNYIFTPQFIEYTLTDDAGNKVTLLGNRVFYITNDTTEQSGGGGGSLNFSNISKKTTLQRFTPSQSKEFHDKNSAIHQKSAAQLRLESLKKRMTFPNGSPSRIVSKPVSLIQQQREAWRSRQEALAADGTPKKMQHTLEQLALPQEDPEAIAEARVDHGEFKLQSTLDRLKGIATPTSTPASRRDIAPGHRGKYLEIQR